MTHQPLTKAEREELQSFAADRMNVSEHSSSLIYRALADLDAAEANYARCAAASQDVLKEMVSVTAQRDRAESELDAERRMRVEAEAAAKRAEEERDSYRDRLADERQKLLAMEEQAMVDDDEKSLRPFDERLRKVEAERDALKAKLDRCETNLRAANSDCADADVQMAELKAKLAAAESAHSELFLSGQVAELRAKLAALVETATDLREVAFDGPSEPKGAGCAGGKEGLFDWKERINRESAAAIAAARGGAQ